MVFKIKYSDAELQQLLEDKHSCVEIEKGVKHIGIHPFYMGNLSKGINETLDKLIGKYDKPLDGIVIMYKNPKSIQQYGAISTTQGHIYFDVEAEFYLFRPEVNKVCKGVVNKTSKDHVGCLVNKAFNVSIPNSSGDSKWKGSKLRTGDEILLKITFTDLFYVIPYIRGEIVEILTQKTVENGENDSIKIKSPKKRKRESLPENIISDEIQETPPKKKKREHEVEIKIEGSKKEKRKLNEIEDLQNKLLEQVQKDTPNAIPVKKEKVKKKKQEEVITKIKVEKPEIVTTKKSKDVIKHEKKKEEPEIKEEVKTKKKKKQENYTNSLHEEISQKEVLNENSSPTKKHKKENKKLKSDVSDMDELRNSLILSVLNESNSPTKKPKKQSKKNILAEPQQILLDESISPIKVHKKKSKDVCTPIKTDLNETVLAKPKSSEKKKKVDSVREIADLPDQSVLDSPGFSSTLKSPLKSKKKKKDKSADMDQNDLLQKLLKDSLK